MAPGCDTDRPARFYSCPLAEFIAPGSSLWEVVSTHRIIDVDGVSLRALYRRPTRAILDGLATVDGAIHELRAVQRERDMKAAQDKAKRAERGGRR